MKKWTPPKTQPKDVAGLPGKIDRRNWFLERPQDFRPVPPGDNSGENRKWLLPNEIALPRKKRP